jgi:oxygen-dependent protoporphyrinogen oxidase
VFLGFAKEPDCRPLDGFGFLVPEVERRKILGCIWSSTIFAGRAPLSGAALTVFVGGMRQPALAALPEPDLQALVLDELGDLMGLHSSPDFVGFRKWEKAIPQYELGHQGRIEQVEKMEWRYPGLFIGGNFRGGVSVGDCILRGGELASNVEKTLIERRAVPQGVED